VFFRSISFNSVCISVLLSKANLPNHCLIGAYANYFLQVTAVGIIGIVLHLCNYFQLTEARDSNILSSVLRYRGFCVLRIKATTLLDTILYNDTEGNCYACTTARPHTI